MYATAQASYPEDYALADRFIEIPLSLFNEFASHHVGTTQDPLRVHSNDLSLPLRMDHLTLEVDVATYALLATMIASFTSTYIQEMVASLSSLTHHDNSEFERTEFLHPKGGLRVEEMLRRSHNHSSTLSKLSPSRRGPLLLKGMDSSR